MIKRSEIFLFLLLCGIIITTHAQEVYQPPSLNYGDVAPPLMVSEWIKGTPVQKIEKGKIYVIEFWSTWCGPCLKAMPHLSKLARKYKGRVTFVGINILEKKRFPRAVARAIVDSMGHWLKYPLAFEDSNKMNFGWMEASGVYAIPSSFVVNGEGRIAWIGHPTELADVLAKVLNKTWDIDEALAKRERRMQLEHMDGEANEQLRSYSGNFSPVDLWGEPDTALSLINKIVSKEPDLKYADLIAFHTFDALLKTDMHEAYEYAKNAISTSNPMGPAYFAVISGLKRYPDLLNIPPELWRLGGSAMEAGRSTSPDTFITAAEWYFRGGDKLKATRCLKKARKAMKTAKLYEGMGFLSQEQ